MIYRTYTSWPEKRGTNPNRIIIRASRGFAFGFDINANSIEEAAYERVRMFRSSTDYNAVMVAQVRDDKLIHPIKIYRIIADKDNIDGFRLEELDFDNLAQTPSRVVTWPPK